MWWLLGAAAGAIIVGGLAALFFNDNKVFFHYTDEQGARGIKRERKIIPSVGPGDVMIGKGVYMTTKDPDRFTKEEIVQNNYDSYFPRLNPYLDRVKYAVKMTLPMSDVVKAEKTSRDVYKYKSEGYLDLNNYPHEIIRVD